MRYLTNKKGFTLIELVIVIILLSMLAAISYPKYIDLRNDAHKARDDAIIGSLRAGIHIYFAKNKTFPNTVTLIAGCLEGGLPQGWSITPDQGASTFTIKCDGLPTDNDDVAEWTYNPTDGSIVVKTPHS